jgi:hypothetical protein
VGQVYYCAIDYLPLEESKVNGEWEKQCQEGAMCCIYHLCMQAQQFCPLPVSQGMTYPQVVHDVIDHQYAFQNFRMHAYASTLTVCTFAIDLIGGDENHPFLFIVCLKQEADLVAAGAIGTYLQVGA